jgi:hypothetical protein
VNLAAFDQGGIAAVDLAVNKRFEMEAGERDAWLQKAAEAGSVHAKLVLAGRRLRGS